MGVRELHYPKIRTNITTIISAITGGSLYRWRNERELALAGCCGCLSADIRRQLLNVCLQCSQERKAHKKAIKNIAGPIRKSITGKQI
ncbi:MAG: hypothetical protein E3K29_06855 [Candidatus Brocadia sp.]|nr:hypothetical protein [Candidatus Brocadia sp.]